MAKAHWFIEGALRKMAQRTASKIDRSASTHIDLPELRFTYDNWFYPYHFLSQDNMRDFFLFDSEGIPTKLHVQDIRERSPLAPAYWGLILINDYLRDHSADALNQAARCGEYLDQTSVEFKGASVIFRNEPYQKFQTADKWYAGISQGLAVSLFCRLYKLSKDKSWLDKAIGFARSMEISMAEGGVVSLTEAGNPWIEEYPGATTSNVLNGFMFSLIALTEIEAISDYRWEYQQYTIRDLHISLLESMPLYIKGPFLRYDLLHGDYCNPHYVGLHTLLFYHLHKLTGVDLYHEYFQLFFKKTWWRIYFNSYGLRKSEFYIELAKLRSTYF